MVCSRAGGFAAFALAQREFASIVAMTLASIRVSFRETDPVRSQKRSADIRVRHGDARTSCARWRCLQGHLRGALIAFSLLLYLLRLSGSLWLLDRPAGGYTRKTRWTRIGAVPVRGEWNEPNGVLRVCLWFVTLSVKFPGVG